MNKRQITQLVLKQGLNPTLFLILLGLVVGYVYFLSMTVVHVVVQKDSSYERTEIASKITDLESRYIAAQHRISVRITESDDFLEPERKVFVSRSAPSLVLHNEGG